MGKLQLRIYFSSYEIHLNMLVGRRINYRWCTINDRERKWTSGTGSEKAGGRRCKSCHHSALHYSAANIQLMPECHVNHNEMHKLDQIQGLAALLVLCPFRGN